MKNELGRASLGPQSSQRKGNDVAAVYILCVVIKSIISMCLKYSVPGIKRAITIQFFIICCSSCSASFWEVHPELVVVVSGMDQIPNNCVITVDLSIPLRKLCPRKLK